MSSQHFKFWPQHSLHHLEPPATNVFYNLEVSARRRPEKPCLIYYDTRITYAEIFSQAQALAGYLEHRCGVRKGDRVLLYMQNSPQFVIAYYAILRANAVVVPLNPMYLTQEFLRAAKDAGAVTAIVSQELYPRVEPLLRNGELKQVIVAAYSDYLKNTTEVAIPQFISAPRAKLASHLEHEGARAKAIVALSEKYRVSLQAFLGQVQSLSGSVFSTSRYWVIASSICPFCCRAMPRLMRARE